MNNDETITELLTSRKGWLRVIAVPKGPEPDAGWDVALKLDGTYFHLTEAQKNEMLEHWEQRIEEAVRAELKAKRKLV